MLVVGVENAEGGGSRTNVENEAAEPVHNKEHNAAKSDCGQVQKSD